MDPWNWQYYDLPLSQIDAIEIIADPYYRNIGDTNEKAVALLDILWNSGFCITGIGGSDTHTKFSISQLGQPVTKIYAKPGSLCSMIEGIKKHRAQIFIDCDCSFTYMSEGILIPCLEGERREDPLRLGERRLAFLNLIYGLTDVAENIPITITPLATISTVTHLITCQLA